MYIYSISGLDISYSRNKDGRQSPKLPITGPDVKALGNKMAAKMRSCMVIRIILPRALITGPDICHFKNKDGRQNSIIQLKYGWISRFSGYRASGYQTLTVLTYGHLVDRSVLSQ
jgi:hypothetical protein